MITKAFERAFVKARKKGWDKIYVAIDIHETMIYPNYEFGKIPTEFYQSAAQVLREMTERKDLCLILYTCSHPHEIEQYAQLFKSMGIRFDYYNENPEVITDLKSYGNYDKKFYFDVLLEDKAGFDPESEWGAIGWYLGNNSI